MMPDVTSTPSGGVVTAPARAGERWGPFMFFNASEMATPLPPDQITPAPRPLKGDEGASLIADHRGYREFKTIDGLAAFLSGRAVLRVPQFLPDDAGFIGGYAVEGDEGRVFLVGLSYRLGQSNAPVHDPDLWIVYNLYTPRPGTFLASEKPAGLGRVIGAPVLLKVRGQEAIWRETTNPPGLARDQIIASSLNWFEDDGSAWAVQPKGLDLETVVAIAESLTDYE